jgi:hypothetical protein
MANEPDEPADDDRDDDAPLSNTDPPLVDEDDEDGRSDEDEAWIPPVP